MNKAGLREVVLRNVHRITKARSTARESRATDIYLVEFPKSGITWLSTLIANAALIHTSSVIRATYYNVLSLVPDVHVVGRDVGEGLSAQLGCRVIKSHDFLNLNYKNVIYLHRDPFAVMCSYLRFKRQVANPGLGIKHILMPNGVLEQWKVHVRSWLEYPDQRRRMTILSYESLINDAVNELDQLFRIIGLRLPATTLEQAVELSSATNMQQDENLYRSRNPRYRLALVTPGSGQSPESELEAYRSEIYERTSAERAILGIGGA